MDAVYGTTEKIIDFIRAHYIKHLKFPTYQEIADALSIGTKSTVYSHMKKWKSEAKLNFTVNNIDLIVIGC